MKKFILIILCMVLNSLHAEKKVIVGIAGGTGSGKTTLAHKIQQYFPDCSILISQDSYYRDLSHLPFEERAKNNFDHPSSIDFATLRDHLVQLKNGETIQQPIYSFCTHSRLKETQAIEPSPVIIVEGILLFTNKELLDLFDIKIFVDTDDDIRLLRRIERDIRERGRTLEDIKVQYLSTVKPMHDKYVGPSKQHANLIIPGKGESQVALDMVAAKLGQDLQCQ